MALKSNLSLQQTQRIALTPQMRQSLSILRMPLPDLLSHIEAEANDNPLLLVRDPVSGNPEAASAFDYALSHVAATVTLGESIRQQLVIMPLDTHTQNIATYLTGDLSEDGYLETTIAETADALGVDETRVEAAVTAIQSCEPTGVGARDLKECLFLQLVEKGIAHAFAKQALAHIELMIAEDWPALMRLTDRPKAELIALASQLRGLNPNPVASPDSGSAPKTVDIIVINDEKRGLIISLANQYLPHLSLNKTLLSQAKADKSAGSYVEENRARAQALIQAMHYRGKTLLRLARAIVTRQHRFFIDGPNHLGPLNRTGLADEMSLHKSTVGRTIADKNLEFNGVIYPLAFFLSARLNKGETGQISAYCVQQSIRRMIAAESQEKTLSDEAIVKELHREGVDIARRTVAKYRRCMKIPSSFERRRIFAAQRRQPDQTGGTKHMNP